MKVFLFISIFILTQVFSKQELIRVGSIHGHYANQLTKSQLELILIDIEETLETQLGQNIFDLSSVSGKPIDIVYTPPSKQKQNLNELTKQREQYKRKIEILQNYFEKKQPILIQKSQNITDRINSYNDTIDTFNQKVEKLNKQKFSQDEYKKTALQIKKEQRSNKNARESLRQLQTKFKDLQSSYNQKISLYNSHITHYNRLIRKIENISRTLKEIKGVTLGMSKVEFTTYYKDGQLQTKKETTSSMEKIEIYGFDSLDELKVILAHEIGHLIGVKHIHKEGALMNPILQNNQISYLHLTSKDKELFQKSLLD
jgi:hypothetical protein